MVSAHLSLLVLLAKKSTELATRKIFLYLLLICKGFHMFFFFSFNKLSIFFSNKNKFSQLIYKHLFHGYTSTQKRDDFSLASVSGPYTVLCIAVKIFQSSGNSFVSNLEYRSFPLTKTSNASLVEYEPVTSANGHRSMTPSLKSVNLLPCSGHTYQ